MPRERLRLPFGGGLDRESGQMAAAPGSFRDLTNFLPREGKAVLRRGMAKTATLVGDAGGTPLSAPGDAVILIHPLRTEGVAVALGWRASDRTVHLNRLTGEGAAPTYIGQWVHDWGDTPPSVSAAESYGKLFLAHDQGLMSQRAPTVYYDAATGSVEALRADLDNDDAEEPLRFRGVTTFLSYLVGWGFGSGTGVEMNRPEVVRVSMPGEPTVFDPEHYFIAGQRGDPVLSCNTAGYALIALKRAEKYDILGDNFQNFGILSVGELFGVANPHLAVTVGGTCYAWSLDGPRVHEGRGPSVDIALPLDLEAPDADMLERGFAAYEPRSRSVLFVFGTEVYALAIHNPAQPRWYYMDLGVEVACGGVLYPGGVVSEAYPPGYVDDLAAEDAGPSPQDPAALRDIRVSWSNHEMAGDERIDIWLRPSGGSWSVYDSVPVSFAATQEFLIRGRASGTAFQVAARARRGNTPRTGYEDNTNPGAWPTGGPVSVTTQIRAPKITSATWRRHGLTTEFVDLELGVDPSRQTRIYRRVGSGGAYSLVETLPAGVDSYSYPVQAGEGESRLYFYADHTGPAVPDGPDSEAVNVWTGPATVPTIALLDTSSVLGDAYEIVVVSGDAQATTEVWDRNVTDGGSFSLVLEVNSDTRQFVQHPAQGGDTYQVRARNRVLHVSTGAVDYSDWTTIRTVELSQ